MFNPLKRKNDEKVKHRSLSRRALDLLALILIILVMSGAVLWLTRPFTPYSPYPAAHLYYTSDGHSYALNFQTGEHTAVQPPAASVIHPDAPPDLVVAQALVGANEHTPFVTSPNGQWFVGWKHIRDRWEWELMLYGELGDGYAQSLGIFRGVIAEAPISWAPDSKAITFSANPPTSGPSSTHDEELWRVAIPSGDIIRLTHNNTRDTVPHVSPDGTQIVYISTADGYHRLYIMEVATGASHLISSEIFGFSPVWSPDGRWIAYISNQFSASMDIWLVRPDGTGAKSVVQSTEDDRDPMWLP